MFSVFIVLISLALSFFFAGMEIAYVSADKMQLHVEGQQNEGFSGRLFAHIAASPVHFLVTLLLGNTLALVVFGLFMANILGSLLQGHSLSEFEILVIQTIVTTGIVLVAADFIPKSLFRISPNRLLKLFALPCIVIYYLLWPFTTIVLQVAHFMTTKLFGESLIKNKSTFTKKDLFSYINLHQPESAKGSENDEPEVQLFKNALMFPDVKVRDCMVSRLDVIAADVNEGTEKLKERFLQTGLSRILVFDNNLDNVLGYVHYHEIFKNSSDIRSLILPAPVIPESMPAKEALRIFIQQHKSMASVVDEFGVVSGILTTEDIIEEIFGEIEDEYDKEELLEKNLAPNEYLLSARLEIDYLNQKYEMNLPVSQHYTTLAGLILHETGTIPKAKQHINVGKFQFRIISATPTRVEQVHLIISRKPGI